MNKKKKSEIRLELEFSAYKITKLTTRPDLQKVSKFIRSFINYIEFKELREREGGETFA